MIVLPTVVTVSIRMVPMVPDGGINVSVTCCYVQENYGTQANVSRETQANVSRKYEYIELLLGMFALGAMPLFRRCGPPSEVGSKKGTQRQQRVVDKVITEDKQLIKDKNAIAGG